MNSEPGAVPMQCSTLGIRQSSQTSFLAAGKCVHSEIEVQRRHPLTNNVATHGDRNQRLRVMKCGAVRLHSWGAGAYRLQVQMLRRRPLHHATSASTDAFSSHHCPPALQITSTSTPSDPNLTSYVQTTKTQTQKLHKP
jgi:hypothetical protein